MSKNTPATKKTSNSTLIKFGLIVTLVFMLFVSIMQFATYPTASHRNIAQQIEQINRKPISEQNTKTVQEQMMTLGNSMENQYSTNLLIANTVAYFVVFIAITGSLYQHIRSKRLAKNPLYTTTNIMVISTLIATVYSSIFNAYFVGLQIPGAAGLIGILVSNTILTLLLALIVTSFFKNRYDRKHSFEID